MGMLSLAGIVSGAGAGAGKSLRQAQTYLNWEMLQEERGKLELQREDRISERNIENEKRHMAQARANLAETQSDEYINKTADAAVRYEQAAQNARSRVRPGAENESVLIAESNKRVRDRTRLLNQETAIADLESKAVVDKWLEEKSEDRTIEKLGDPKHKKIFDLTLAQAAAEKKSVDQAIVDRSEYLNRPENKVISLAYENVAKLGMTRTQKLTLEDLEFNALHRKENYDATQRERLAKITDRDSDRISRMLTSSERTLEGYRKSIAATTNEIEKASLQDLENQELRLHHDIEARARKIFGLPDAPPFKLSDKLNGGTTSTKGAKPKTPNYDPSSIFDSISDEELIVAPPRKG